MQPIVYDPEADRLAYHEVQAELPELTLSDLDESAVAGALRHAIVTGREWPPRPVETGWMVMVRSLA